MPLLAVALHGAAVFPPATASNPHPPTTAARPKAAAAVAPAGSHQRTPVLRIRNPRSLYIPPVSHRRPVRAAISWTARWLGAGLAAACLLAFISTRWIALSFEKDAVAVDLEGGAVRAFYWSLWNSTAYNPGFINPPFERTIRLGEWASVFVVYYPSELNILFGLPPHRPFSEFWLIPSGNLRSGVPRGVTVPLWLPFAVFASSSLIAWRRRATSHERGVCASCQYDLTGLAASAPCPECGRHARRPRLAHRPSHSPAPPQ